MPSLDKLLLFGFAPSLRMKVLDPPSATAEDSPVNLQGTQDPHSAARTATAFTVANRKQDYFYI